MSADDLTFDPVPSRRKKRQDDASATPIFILARTMLRIAFPKSRKRCSVARVCSLSSSLRMLLNDGIGVPFPETDPTLPAPFAPARLISGSAFCAHLGCIGASISLLTDGNVDTDKMIRLVRPAGIESELCSLTTSIPHRQDSTLRRRYRSR